MESNGLAHDRDFFSSNHSLSNGIKQAHDGEFFNSNNPKILFEINANNHDFYVFFYLFNFSHFFKSHFFSKNSNFREKFKFK